MASCIHVGAVELVRDHSPKLIGMYLQMALVDGRETHSPAQLGPETAPTSGSAEDHLPTGIQKGGCAYLRKAVAP